MALINCDECSKEISDKAAACPQCGAPVEKKEYAKTEENITNEKVKIQQNFQQREPDPQPINKKNGTWKIITVIVVIVLGFIAFLMLQDNPNAIPGVKIEVNPPQPVIITSRADAKKSTLIKLKETVYVTVQNQGGDGNVLITFIVSQAGNDYKRSQSIYMRSNESIDLNETFSEVKMLDGQITYDVNARAE